MPSYKLNRFCSIFFVVFSFLGTFLIMNLLTAIIYNQFRGFLQRTLQHSLNRRHIAFIGSFFKLIEAENMASREFRASYVETTDVIKFSTLKSCLSLLGDQITNIPDEYKNMDNEATLDLETYLKVLNTLCFRKAKVSQIPKTTKFPRKLVDKIFHCPKKYIYVYLVL